MFVDKAEYQSMEIITCPLRGCNHVWCKRCESSIQRSGPRHTCDGSSELEHLAKASGWRHCPGKISFWHKNVGLTDYRNGLHRLPNSNTEGIWLQSYDGTLELIWVLTDIHESFLISSVSLQAAIRKCSFGFSHESSNWLSFEVIFVMSAVKW